MSESLMPVRGYEAIVRAYDALALAAADLPCSNGCGCEEYDYCAQDACRVALQQLRGRFGVPNEGSVKPGGEA